MSSRIDYSSILEGQMYRDPGHNGGNPLPLPQVQNIVYQLEDAKIDSENQFDYQLGKLDGIDVWFRNLADGFNLSSDYIVALGAAQTFGRGVKYPYCDLIASSIKKPCLNLGVGGVGPSFYSMNSSLVDIINGASGCLMNIMSPRSVDLEPCIPTGSCVYQVQKQKYLFWSSYVEYATRSQFSSVEALIEKLKEKYIEDYLDLVSKIKVPIIFFNFSSKGEDSSKYQLKFPQYIDGEIMHKLKNIFPVFIEEVSVENNNRVKGLQYYLSQKAHICVASKYLAEHAR